MDRKYRFTVQEKKKLRIIIDTDAACEADDAFAIVHALLTPRFQVRGIIAEQFVSEGQETSMEKSYAEVQKILSLMNIEGMRVCRGVKQPLRSEQESPQAEGVDFLIEEALRRDECPLYVLCQGALTNVAAAINRCPEIQDRFTCVWIGGGFYPRGGWEFNCLNDYHAANRVFRSQVEFWQIPMECYTTMQLGYAELQRKVRPCGEIGKYLFEQMIKVGMEADWVMGESWSLGDSPALAVVLNQGCGRYAVRRAPAVDSEGYYHDCEENREIRVYQQVDSRYVLEDFFAKLAICYGNG